jgi:hypothetical protein
MNLERLQGLEEKATVGPWISSNVNIHGGKDKEFYIGYTAWEYDQNFIVEMRNAAPLLLSLWDACLLAKACHGKLPNEIQDALDKLRES